MDYTIESMCWNRACLTLVQGLVERGVSITTRSMLHISRDLYRGISHPNGDSPVWRLANTFDRDGNRIVRRSPSAPVIRFKGSMYRGLLSYTEVNQVLERSPDEWTLAPDPDGEALVVGVPEPALLTQGRD